MSLALASEAAATIRAGSQSFAAASRMFDPRTRVDAHLLYAWCRHCDDVVDDQVLGQASAGGIDADVARRRERLDELDRKTRAALAGDPPDEPAFLGLRQVATSCRLDPRWPLEHLQGFAMDVEPRLYPDLDALLVYAWRVAGVVGVMMAAVMGVDPDDLDTLRRAQDLGLAFQLTNIARDVAEDARAGRVYLPVDMLARHGVEPTPAALGSPAARRGAAATACDLVDAAEPFYRSAGAGLAALPWRSAWAVASARGVYRAIGRRVRRLGEGALERRVATSAALKLGLVAGALAPALAARMRASPARSSLWSAF